MARNEVLDRVTQLGDRVNGHPECVSEVVPLLVALLDEQDDAVVISAIVEALGHAWDEQASLRVLPLATHPHATVRLAVARALPGGVESHAATVVVAEALVRLSGDTDDDVRDWATFGIGSILTLDTPEVRQALVARAGDPSQAVRDEALVGLAHRRDPRALPLVEQRLGHDRASRLVFEAAEYLAHPALLDALRGWLDDDPSDEDVLRAHRACDPAYQAARTERQAALLASVQRLLSRRPQPRSAALYCDRSTTDVLMEIDAFPRVWFVDTMLEDGDVAVDAANRILDGLDRM